LILFYLVFQVNYMSLAENWNGKGKKNHTVLANDRSTPAIVRPGERAPQLDERALVMYKFNCTRQLHESIVVMWLCKCEVELTENRVC
jgi:hypothetical protein